MNRSRPNPDRKPISDQDFERVNEAIVVLHNSDPTGPGARNAGEVIEAFLRDQLFGVAQWRAGTANDMSATELYQTAMVALLAQFSQAKSYRPADTKLLCEAFCRLLYQETVNHLRKLKNRPKTELPREIEADGHEPRRVDQALELNCLEEAVVWLDRNRPELSSAFKARLLVNHNLRFSQANGSFSRFLREQIRSTAATDVEMGKLLGISSQEAKKQYNQALEALRGHFPEDFFPSGPTKKGGK